MKRIFFALSLFLFAYPIPARETISNENVFCQQYSPSDIQKMRWLAGAWKGGEIRQTFLFHGGNSLEVLIVGKDGKMTTSTFVWKDGRYYYGENRQWVVTWIGEKDVRLDPVVPNLAPMTWTRQSDKRWHLVRHTPGGDEITVMESADEMQP